MSTEELASLHEYLLVFCKNRQSVNIIGHALTEEMSNEYKYEDQNGRYRLLGLRMRGGFWRRTERPNLYFPIYINPNDGSVSVSKDEKYIESAVPVQPSTMEDGTWRWSKEKISEMSDYLIGRKVKRNDEFVWDVFQKDYFDREGGRRTKAKSIWEESEINYQNGTNEIKELFGNTAFFDYPKPIYLIKHIMEMVQMTSDDIVLDFFSGSATTAHAVMQLNAEDGGHRKFIMVQLPGTTDEKSEAYKAGYKTICEIGKERIRRAGAKIKKQLKKITIMHTISPVESNDNTDNKDFYIIKTMYENYKGVTTIDVENLSPDEVDVGFRVFKLDDSNMKDVYFAPAEIDQQMLLDMESNIKEDRTDLDLLFGCLLEWGLPLSMPYTSESIDGCTVHTYNDGDLIACFDSNIPESVIKAIAKRKPLRAVFRDSCFESSPQKINVGEIFKLLAPDTRVKVI